MIPQQISTAFASCLRYCTDVAQRRLSKLCMMFGRLLGWYTIYTFLWALAPDRIFPRGTYFPSKSCVIILYWQRYCMALEQWVSAKLWGVVQGMQLMNFSGRCNLYSAGRPPRWASAHILVFTLVSHMLGHKMVVCVQVSYMLIVDRQPFHCLTF